MYKYMRNHVALLDTDSLLITIYDQLNPSYSKYYKKEEALQLLTVQKGINNIEIHHRHGYSYTLMGTRFF